MDTQLLSWGQAYLLYFYLLLSYLIGSIPFGLLISSLFFRTDLRQHGSGNIGMTNVMRVVGRLPGILTFLFDFGKGTLVVIGAHLLFAELPHAPLWSAGIVVFGHTRSLFLLGKGGKGVATNLGVWLFLSWGVFGVMAILWLLVYRLFKLSSLAALCSLASLPLAAFFLQDDWATTLLAILLWLYITALHHQNIRRLLKREELRM